MNLTERLIRIYLFGDRIGVTHFKVTISEMQTIILEAARLEGVNPQLPWETGAAYDQRTKANEPL